MIRHCLEVFLRYQDAFGKAFLETFEMLAAALFFALVLGLVLGILIFATRPSGLWHNRPLYAVLSGLINITRSVPFILFIIVMIPVNRAIMGTGFGVNASKVPLSIIGIALFARFTEQNLLDVDRSIYETSYALGASTLQYFWHFLLKEARSGLILSFTSTAISLISYSTVMGVIGGGGLGYLAISEGYNNFNYELMWMIILAIVIMVQLIQTAGSLVARIFDKR